MNCFINKVSYFIVIGTLLLRASLKSMEKELTQEQEVIIEKRQAVNCGINSLQSTVFSPDGTTIFIKSNNNRAHLWDVQAGKLAATLTDTRGFINVAVFSPDSKTFFTSGEINGTGYAILWNLEGKRIATMVGPKGFLISRV